MKIAILPSVFVALLTVISLSACSPILLVGATAGAGATIATDRRSAGKIVEDQAIEMQASDFIYSNKTFGKKVHVSVTSVNSIVLLTGEVPKIEYSQIIYEKIRRMRPVKKVINKIEIRPTLSMSDRSNDVWITGRVKTKLLAKKGLLSRTKVVTSANHVYLMGMVNDTEANEIISIIKEISGIEKVTPLYEAYKGQLSQTLSANSHKSSSTKNIDSTAVRQQKLENEDDITMKPYVLQPAITLSNDE